MLRLKERENVRNEFVRERRGDGNRYVTRRELEDSTTMCLTFTAPGAEAAYARRSDPCPLSGAAPPLLLLPAVVALASFAVPPSWALHAVYLALVLETGLINVIYYACYRYAQYKVCFPFHLFLYAVIK